MRTRSDRIPQDAYGHGGRSYRQGVPTMHPEGKILLVEDDDLDAELASRAFQRAKVTNALVRVHDGVEALDYLFARGEYAARDVHDLPVFVLLDLDIPKISRLRVLEAIRADACTRHLPVIILTSSGDHFANSYVIKPLDYDQFVAVAQQLSLYWTELNEPAPLMSS